MVSDFESWELIPFRNEFSVISDQADNSTSDWLKQMRLPDNPKIIDSIVEILHHTQQCLSLLSSAICSRLCLAGQQTLASGRNLVFRCVDMQI